MKIGNYNTQFRISADYDLYFRLIKNNFEGKSTPKNILVGNVASGGFSSTHSFLDHCIEEAKIRIHNKQSLILVFIIFLIQSLKILISYFF